MAVLSENAIIRRTASRSLNVGTVSEMVGQDSRTRHLVLLLEDHDSIEVDLLGGSLAIRFDHDRKLDQAGRRHDLRGVILERLTRAQMLDRHGDLAFMSDDQWHQARLKSRRGLLGLGPPPKYGPRRS